MLNWTDPGVDLELLVVKPRERVLLKQCRILKKIRKSQGDFLITTGPKHRHPHGSVRMTSQRLPALHRSRSDGRNPRE